MPVDPDTEEAEIRWIIWFCWAFEISLGTIWILWLKKQTKNSKVVGPTEKVLFLYENTLQKMKFKYITHNSNKENSILRNNYNKSV